VIASLRKRVSELRTIKDELAELKALLVDRSSPADGQLTKIHIPE
jgi:hypothetical protein